MPDLSIKAAIAIACPEDEHAEVVAKLGPVIPYLIDIWLHAALGISLGTVNGCARVLFSQ